MTMQTNDRPDANQLLLTGGKAPEGADFGPTPPGTVAGKVLAGPTTYHAREFDRANPGQGPLRYWPDGNPVYGVYVDLDMPGHGIRRLYIEKLRMTTAIQQAMLRAGAHTVDPGGFLSVTWTGTETGQGNMPANTYYAEYSPPGVLPPANKILTNGQATAQVAHSGPAQWQQGVPGATLPQYVPTQTAPAPTYAPPPAPPVQPQPAMSAPPVQPPAPQALTETIAAAMRNAGIPTDGYTIIPG